MLLTITITHVVFRRFFHFSFYFMCLHLFLYAMQYSNESQLFKQKQKKPEYFKANELTNWKETSQKWTCVGFFLTVSNRLQSFEINATTMIRQLNAFALIILYILFMDYSIQHFFSPV